MVYCWLVKNNRMVVNIVAMEFQIRMTLNVAGEEVIGLGRVLFNTLFYVKLL